ncbi:HAMP domain-containing histidine kinase [Ancylothrix sp. C2]|uniref:sensor histidine kinase n=1 Tax=Ancylothrix sp. D3o TaxID=2953691 RepID=UPI0021BB00E9|nr:HAMP domain-containing sensor histidine kinase [Ancylothrix sp. D3o]MCT7949118.1 HAMP domain-containing histidine kinase [Ancylothrix sp. D3o]
MKLRNNSRPTVINGTDFYSSLEIMVENASEFVNSPSSQVINSRPSGGDNNPLSSNSCSDFYFLKSPTEENLKFPINSQKSPFSERDLQAISECCKDEKAFEELQQILLKAWGNDPEKDRLKDVILHTVAHDLRTSVLGTLMLFKHLMSQPEEMITISRSVVDRLVQGNKRHLEMINALLETYFPEDEAMVLAGVVRFSALVETIFKDLAPMLEKNQLKLINLVSTSLPPVVADPVQIQRVFETLITHIAFNNPPGLTLTVKAEVEAKMMRCSIANNGAQISPVECNRLFDLYIREPQHRSGTSTGLKLYLCRQIIRSLNGEIGVEPSADSGVTFWFTLPLVSAVSQKS